MYNENEKDIINNNGQNDSQRSDRYDGHVTESNFGKQVETNQSSQGILYGSDRMDGNRNSIQENVDDSQKLSEESQKERKLFEQVNENVKINFQLVDDEKKTDDVLNRTAGHEDNGQSGYNQSHMQNENHGYQSFYGNESDRAHVGDSSQTGGDSRFYGRNESEQSNYNFWEEQNGNRNASGNREGQTSSSSEYRIKYEHNGQPDNGQMVNSNYNRQNEYGQTGYSQGSQNFGGNVGANYESNFRVEKEEPVKEKKKSKGHKVLKLVGAAAVFGLVAGLTFQGVGYVTGMLNPPQETSNNNVIEEKVEIPEEYKVEKTVPTANTTNFQNVNDVSGIVEDVMPSIVSITSTVTQTGRDFFGNQFSQDVEGSGSGIIVGKNDKELLIVTNNHVIDSANGIVVKFIDDKIANAELKGKDASNDLAVISIQLSDIEKSSLEEIKIASLGDSESVKVGEMAIAIGNAMGYGQSVTVGYVSAKDRQVDLEDKSMVLLQTDAAINPGNSGGALLNVKGEVIGINTVKVAANEVEGIGYAIPISSALPIMNDLMTKEVIKESEQGFLGITGNTIEKDNALNLPQGAYVISVYEDAAGDKAGILQGDIIVKVNDMEVTTFESLREKVNGYKIGTEVKLTLMRMVNGSYQEVEVTAKLGKVPVTEETTGETTEEQTTPPNNNNGQRPDQNDPYGNGSGNSQNPYGMDEDLYNEFFNFFN